MGTGLQKILVIAGPTATGKTGLALEFAKHFSGEIIGADSVQVYRGFDIGSAKPTPAELEGIAHHLIDVVDANEAIDAARFAELADAAIAAVARAGKVPIVVGGTGLWLRALLRGLVQAPPVDLEVRARLDRRAAEEGLAVLYAYLQRVDPDAAQMIHANDQLRIVRALEVYEQTGTPMGKLRREHALGGPRYDAFFLVLDLPRDELRKKMVARTRSMINAGFAEEVRSLLARFGPNVRAFGSVGYKEMLAHVQGHVPLEQIEEAIVRATHVYSRRQRTWFRSMPGVSWRGRPEDALQEPLLTDLRAHLNR